MRTGTIYGLLCPIRKEIVYVGQTTNYLHKRLAEHKAPKAPFKKSPLYQYTNSLRAAGLIGLLKIVVLRDGLPISALDSAEIAWVNELNKQGCQLLNVRKSAYGRKRALDLLDRPTQEMTGFCDPIPSPFLESLRSLQKRRGAIKRAAAIAKVATSRLRYIINTGKARPEELEVLMAIIQPETKAA